MDKEKVLPRLSSQVLDLLVDPERCYRIQLARLGMEHLEQVAEAQRDADWEVLQRDYVPNSQHLAQLEAIVAFLKKIVELEALKAAMAVRWAASDKEAN